MIIRGCAAFQAKVTQPWFWTSADLLDDLNLGWPLLTALENCQAKQVLSVESCLI